MSPSTAIPGDTPGGVAADNQHVSPQETPPTETVATTALPWARPLYDPPTSSNARVIAEDYLPAEDVVHSYTSQWYRFRINGKHYAIRPVSTAVNPANVFWEGLSAPTGHPVDLDSSFIMGYCHPRGIPSAPDDVASLRERARELIRAEGGEPVEIVALHRGSRWLEPMFLVPTLQPEEAFRIADELGQPLVISLRNGYHRATEPNGQERGEASAWHLLELPLAPCPMSLGYEVEHSPTRDGGPWVSRSMVIAGEWQLHFDWAHSLLACEPCQTRVAEKGRAIMLNPWSPPSRYKYIHSVDHDRLGDDHVLRRFEPGTLDEGPRVSRRR